MPRGVVFDTDVLVDFFRGSRKAAELVRLEADRLILPTIVIAELYAGARHEKDRAELDEFVSFFSVADVDGAVAQVGGAFRSAYGPSHGVGLADALIAAVAEIEKADLKTLNVKHYPMIEGLEPAYER